MCRSGVGGGRLNCAWGLWLKVRVCMFKSRLERVYYGLNPQETMCQGNNTLCKWSSSIWWESTECSANKRTHIGICIRVRAHTHKYTGNTSTLRSQVLSLIFMLNLQSLVTRHLCSVCDKGGKKRERDKRKTEWEDRIRDGWGGKRQTLNRGNKRNQPMLSSSTH